MNYGTPKSNMTIYIVKNEQKKGPYTLENAVGMIRKGEFSLSDLAWTEGMADWKPLHLFTDIAGSVMPPIPLKTQVTMPTVILPPIPKQVVEAVQPPFQQPQEASQQKPTQPVACQSHTSSSLQPSTPQVLAVAIKSAKKRYIILLVVAMLLPLVISIIFGLNRENFITVSVVFLFFATTSDKIWNNIRCPKCEHHLGSLIKFHGSLEKGFHFCPFCGIDLGLK